MYVCMPVCLSVCVKEDLSTLFKSPPKKTMNAVLKNKMFCNSFVYGFEFTFLCFTYGCCHAYSVICVTLANLLKVYYVSCYP